MNQFKVNPFLKVSIDNLDSDSDVLSVTAPVVQLRCDRSYSMSPMNSKESYSTKALDRSGPTAAKSRELDLFDLYDQVRVLITGTFDERNRGVPVQNHAC